MKVFLFILLLVSVQFNIASSDILHSDFTVDPASSGDWNLVNGSSWDAGVGRAAKGSIKINSGYGAWISSKKIPVKAGDFILAECWARINDCGETYFRIQLLNGDSVSAEFYGGIVNGINTWRPNSISGSKGWTKLRARVPVWPGIDSFRMVLCKDGEKGEAWFDDVKIRLADKSEIEGELDRKPIKINPKKLKPEDYVTIKNHHLWYKGKRLRIWSAQGNLPGAISHKDIDREVARLKEHGFNAFRSLWWDIEVYDDYTPGDLSEMDRRDYFIALLGRKGMFFWNDWLNSFRIKPEDVNVIDDPATADAWVSAIKQVAGDLGYVRNSFRPIAWDPRCQALYYNYMKRLLNHRNKYNGLTYAEDPTIFCWELINEEWWIMRILWGEHLQLPEFFQKGLYDKWNAWLKEKYGSDEKLIEKWGGLLEGESLDKNSVMLLPLLGDTDASQIAKVLGLNVQYVKLKYSPADFSEARGSDVVEFLMKLHIDFKNKSAKVFKSLGRKGLGNQIVPLIYDTGYSGAVLPLYMHSFADATAVATYVDMTTHDPKHPTFPFTSGLTSPPRVNDWIDNRRVKDKPAFIYENMVFNPQKYRVEYVYRLLALMAIQDYDVVDFHYYGHPIMFWDDPNPHTQLPLQYVLPTYEWSGTVMRQDEIFMSAIKIAGEIFKRHYLEPAPDPTVVTLGRKTLFSLYGIYGGKYAQQADATVFHNGFRWVFNPDQEEDTVSGTLVSLEDEQNIHVVRPTNQISYRWKEGIMTIDDPRAKVLAGFVPQRFEFPDGLILENISINIPKGMPFVIDGERYVCFGIVSLDSKPLNKSGNILISAVNTSFNSGFAMDLEKMAADTAYAYGLGSSIINRGDLPVLVGRVGMTIKANWLKGKSYRMIDYNNNVVSSGKLANNELVIPNNLPVYLVELTN